MTRAEKLAAAGPNDRRRRAGTVRDREVVWECRLRERRAALGLTTREVAAAVGVVGQTISDVERGTNPTLRLARRLAAFFGATVDDLWPRELAGKTEPAEAL